MIVPDINTLERYPAAEPGTKRCGVCGNRRKVLGRCRPEVRDGRSHPLCEPCLIELEGRRHG